MAAAPRYGTATFRESSSGRTYSVDIYISDVANALINWDSGNGAGTGSLTYYKMPVDAVLVDVSLASGLTDTTNMAITKDGGQIAGGRLRYANFLNTLAFRPALQLRFPQGAQVGAIQIA